MESTSTFQRAYLVVLAIVAWCAVGLQVVVTVRAFEANGGSAISAIVHVLSFFAILTNLLVAIVATVSAFVGGDSRGFLTWPSTLTAVAVYIFVVGLVYALLLRSIWDPTGLQLVSDVALHDAIPILYVLYWLIFVPKRGLTWRMPVLWLIYPLAYFVYSVTRGAIIDWYPYWFADPTKLGYPRVLVNVAILLVGFFVMGEIAIGIGRLRE